MDWNPAIGIPLILIGALVLALIYLFGRPKKPEQGERRAPRRTDGGERVEPSIGDPDALAQPEQGELDVSLRSELERLGAAVAEQAGAPRTPPRANVGVRPADRPIERIVTLFVATRGGEPLAGADIVVAAEKAGLEFGDMGIFHRLAGRAGDGPVFSMANMVKPGHFDMARLDEVQTLGVTLFMTLPGPLPALDAWEMMLPTAQRLAELLDAQVLDEGRNALGRQRIAHIRDELRAWDRQQERSQIKPGW
jgi:cell division protein ZipA